MNKKIIMGLFLILLVPTLVSASDFFKYGEQVELRRECFNDGDLCDVTFSCSLTTYNPNGSVILDNVAMVRETSYYNYNLSGVDNGEYRNRMTCTDGTDSGSEIFYFSITPTGDDRGNNIFLILTIGSILFMILTISFRDDTLGFVTGALFLITGVYVMVYGIANLADLYTRAISYISIGLGLLFIISAAYNNLSVSDNKNE